MSYYAMTHIPLLVQQAHQLAERLRFGQSSLDAVGRLLQTLASHQSNGRIGEIGTGCGVGTSWLVSGLQSGTQLITIERDRERAQAVQQLFAHTPQVRVLCGDWHELLAYAPFDLLFADGARVKEQAPEQVLGALRIGGLVVLDDLTPVEQWPDEWRSKPDLTRNFWLNDSRVVASELQVTATQAVILATRRR